MSTYTASASLNYYNSSYGWDDDNQAGQGKYDSYIYTGVIAFPSMNLSGKVIESVSLTVTTSQSGGNWSKTVGVYLANYQGAINTSYTGSQYKGSSLGSLTGTFYDNTVTVNATSVIGNSIASGNNAFVIYSTDTSTYGGYSFSYNYLKWTSVSITVTYQDGLVYIDNGSSFDAYQIYIDNGSSWDRYMPYIDNGSSWDLYT